MAGDVIVHFVVVVIVNEHNISKKVLKSTIQQFNITENTPLLTPSPPPRKKHLDQDHKGRIKI